METIIQAKNVFFSYNQETQEETQEKITPINVLNNVSLDIHKGEFVAILGHNGSGKSTIAKHFNGILVPQNGTVTVNGMDTKDEEKLFEIRQTIGMVFQNPDNQIVATFVE